MLVLVLVLMRILVKLESTGAGADASTCGVSTVLSGSRVVGGFIILYLCCLISSTCFGSRRSSELVAKRIVLESHNWIARAKMLVLPRVEAVVYFEIG